MYVCDAYSCPKVSHDHSKTMFSAADISMEMQQIDSAPTTSASVGKGYNHHLTRNSSLAEYDTLDPTFPLSATDDKVASSNGIVHVHTPSYYEQPVCHTSDYCNAAAVRELIHVVFEGGPAWVLWFVCIVYVCECARIISN